MTESVDVAQLLRSAAERIRTVTEETTRGLQHTTVRLRVLAEGSGAVPDRPVSVADLADAIARVKLAVADSNFSALRKRDARLALRKFTALTVDEGRRLLEAIPSLWPTWVRRFFAARVDLPWEQQVGWATLLAQAPPEIRLLDGSSLNRAALLKPGALDSAMTLGTSVPASAPLPLVFKGLTGPGLLDSRWKYTAVAIATCAAHPARSMSETWAAVASDVQLEALLLPARAPVGSSWFGNKNGSRPTLEASVDAQALLVTALIRAELKQQAATALSAWRTIFFESSFRDPREFADARAQPESAGWRKVKEFQPKLYDAFIDSLLHEDVTLFFSSVEMDSARKSFWQQYVRAAYSSVFFLSQTTRERLRTQFSSADAGIRAALRRARPLRDGGLDAFALRFGRYVIVEFSQQGNAAYLYTAEEFEKVVRDGDLRAADLKRKDLGGRAFRHGLGWEANLQARLAAYGIRRPL